MLDRKEEIDMAGGKGLISRFFRSRRIGFYLTVVAAFFSFVAAILYICAYYNSKYVFWMVPVLLFFAAFLYIPFTFFRETEKIAPLITGGLDFIAFLLFIRHTYLYLSEVFYGGSFGGFSLGFVLFVLCFLFMLIGIVLSNIAIYKRQGEYKTEKSGEVVA